MKKHFWYSAKQHQYLIDSGHNMQDNYVLIDGKLMLYTAINNTDKKTSLFYDDCIYIGCKNVY